MLIFRVFEGYLVWTKWYKIVTKKICDLIEKLNKTIEYFKEINPQLLYPCHCISLEAKIEIGKELKINEIGVGLEMDIN